MLSLHRINNTSIIITMQYSQYIKEAYAQQERNEQLAARLNNKSIPALSEDTVTWVDMLSSLACIAIVGIIWAASIILGA